MFDPDSNLSPKLKSLLEDLAPFVVVVGSVARGKLSPKVLDVIYGDEDEQCDRIRSIIRQHAIPFESLLPGHWGFRDAGQMIEVLPWHEGRSYEDCRRDGKSCTMCGVNLVVAPAGYSTPTDDLR